jgi:hydrogenase maturation protease
LKKHRLLIRINVYRYKNCNVSIQRNMTMTQRCDHRPILVLGVGNTLLTDDGIGVRVVQSLSQAARSNDAGTIVFHDGGTIGLALLPLIADADGVILVDAANFGGNLGEVRRYEGAAMDHLLRAKRSTPHEIAVSDLMLTAELVGTRPARCAMIAVQVGDIGLGDTPQPAVLAATGEACRQVEALLDDWRACA